MILSIEQTLKLKVCYPIKNVSKVKKTMSCIAKFDMDNQWYRATVLNVGDNSVHVSNGCVI